ncbi:MAG: MmcQ/YjbR family DNA-binding protein [Christensenellaceae bacterium]|jgi:predicted DNA-binding protein (MmcQ/YjbR family)|nr:MmcQ/YjbR family DNA-binding protein [Christensenellaceae bacterium]
MSLHDVYVDYPFDHPSSEQKTALIRHTKNKKTFALIAYHQGQIYLNLKCNPLDADFLRQAFEGVIPGWHMNKEHWNTVIIGTDVPGDEIKRQIANSYALTIPKAQRHIKKIDMK